MKIHNNFLLLLLKKGYYHYCFKCTYTNKINFCFLYDNKIIIFNKYFFIKQCLFYLYYYIKNKNFKGVILLINYIIIFLQSYINIKNFKSIDLKNNTQKALTLLNYKCNKINNIFYYIYNLIKYYSKPQHYNQLYNLKHLSYLITNIYMFLYKFELITVVDETWLKWASIGAWTFFTSLFIRKKYKEYKYKYNFNFTNKYKYKNNVYYNFITFWKVYYKYGGSYQQYMYLKNFFLLNKTINKKVLLLYDFKAQKYALKFNNYYNLLLNDLNTDIILNETNHEYNLFNLFLKHKLDTPFLDDNISFTFYYFNKIVDKKKLKNLSYLVSYEYIFKKLKKSAISDLNEKELFENYKNYYKWTMSNNFEKNITDIFGVEGNDPFSTPARIYKKFQEWIDFETLFKNIDDFDIDTLYDYIMKAFAFIKDTDIMLSVNIDEIQNNPNIKTFEELKAAIENNEIDFFDYKIIKNDLNLTMWLNAKALNDKSFISFLNDIKHLTSHSTSNVLNLDLFEDTYLQDNDLLTLFLKEKIFYLDYFTLAINSQKYSLCYLLFIFKVLKNKKNYEVYYNNYCDKKINKYNKIVYQYHTHVFTKLKYLTNSFNSLMQFKANKILKNVNNFDNINFIKQLKKRKFSKTYTFNYKNYIKIEQNDYNRFLQHFNSYKSVDNFEKKLVNITDVITFDEYYYNDVNIFDLYHSIELKKNTVENLIKYYIYEKNKLLNFLELGFYLYDIKGFETYQEDVFLFFEYKEHKYLNFIDAFDINIEDKIEFQKNYSILYFHYLIKLFKNLKHYTFNIVLENIVFDDAFVYLNYDNSMNQKRQDFIFHVECFTKALKTIIGAKHSYIINFVNYLILHYAKFNEYNKEFNYHILYDSLILEKCDKKKLYKIESHLDHIMQVWKHILDKLEESRHFYIESIYMLKLEKLSEFFDFPMFSKVKGFLLLKEAYYICLEELIVEERAFDHAFNISMCLFRTFDKHNTFFRQEILYKNGIMTRLYFLSIEDWNYVFEIEKTNPLILIELYNSKQAATTSEHWNNSVSFLDIVYALSNINEKENAYDTLDDDWNNFFKEVETRDLIIYNLNETNIIKLYDLFKLYNNTWFNMLNIDDEVIIFCQQNFLKYDASTHCFVKIKKNTDFNTDFVQEKSVPAPNNNKKQTIVSKKVNESFSSNRLELYLKDKIVYLNKEDNDMSTLCNQIDKTHEIVEINSAFFKFLEYNIISFQNSNFKNYLLDLFNELNIQYNDFTYLNNYIEFQNSLNDLFYLIFFYNKFNEINKFDVSSIFLVNNMIINNQFNYFDKNSNFINLDYINLIFKSFNKDDIEKDWSNSLSKGFNNRFLFLYYNAPSYLLNIFNILDKKYTYKKMHIEDTINYLPNLNLYINKCNYNNNIIYNIYDLNFINTFDTLFNCLNAHILKVNYMLNQLNTYKDILSDIYLNYYNVNKINMFKDLYFFLYKNTENNNKFKYLALINLLLYVKDPIYLYNILACDLKIYIQNILNILDIIYKPEMHNDTYNSFLNFLMFKHKTLIEDWTKPLGYKGWTFNLYNTNSTIKQKKLDKINVNYFYSYATIINLNNAISNLDQYNGFFNLDNFNLKMSNQNFFNLDQAFNLLDMLNINKLLYNFDYLFSVNNVKGLRFYSLKEFIIYNEVNNFESFYICSNYNMYLTYMLKQSCKYEFYFKNDNIDVKKQEDLIIKDYEALIGLKKKKIKALKRKSAPPIFKKKKRKTKMIKIAVKAELQPEDFKDNAASESDGEDSEYQNDEYGTDVHYKYEYIEVTDSDESSVSDNEINSDTIHDSVSVKKKNLLEIKNDVVSNVHKNFRQWASDLEFRKAYFNCKAVFNTVLFDYTHPIWAEHMHMFPDEAKFLKYVNSLDELDKLSIFHIYWDYTIKEVLKKREKESYKKIEVYWFDRLFNASKQTDPMEKFRSNELLNVFCTNLKENNEWKKKWHHDMYFLDMHRGLPGKESDWRAYEHWKDGYYKETDLNKRQIEGAFERNIFKKQEDQFELWDKTNWWKKW